MPFGSKAKAYNNSKSLAYLTAEQAIADFAVLLTDLKRNLSAEGSPVVLFGGSYGGSKSCLELLSLDYAIHGGLSDHWVSNFNTMLLLIMFIGGSASCLDETQIPTYCCRSSRIISSNLAV
jgi:hypothetical protein